MRRAREKPKDVDCYYHVYNRVAGMPGDRPFKAREKAYFLELVRKLVKYYVVEVTSFVAMGSHYHLTAFVPMEVPSREVACQRYNDYYQGKKELAPDDPECERIALMLRDLSCFMHDLQQQFSAWYNRTRSLIKGRVRRGSVWADRFKSKLLRTSSALWNCLIYHIMNPVREGLVDDPAEYRYSCWGLWRLFRKHPFSESVEKRILPRLTRLMSIGTLDQLRTRVQEQLTVECRT